MKSRTCFTIESVDPGGKARAGVLETQSGKVATPIFMPVGTQATVKTLSRGELDECGADIILSNTYHLFLRPGSDLIWSMGGLHLFMNWDRSILTDSGGYQIFSLSNLRKLDPDGVTFKSHIDGGWNRFTPQGVVEIQEKLGSDIAMVLDDCSPYPCDRSEAGDSVERTLRWAMLSREVHRCDGQLLFAIVQGSTYPELREICASKLVEMDFPGYALGGLSVGEPKDVMMDVVRLLCDILPVGKPRYLMGVGYVEDIIEAVDLGIDMFDCVIPTRNGRNGTCFTGRGRIVVKNAIYARDERPVEEGCGCYTCRTYSRAYLRHLFQVGELLAPRLATLHNVYYFTSLMRAMREAIVKGEFSSWKRNTLAELHN